MVTTLGKIPNEMYYLEDTTPCGKTVYGTRLHEILDNDHTTLTSIQTNKSDGYAERSTLLLVLLTALLLILLLCCITACIIAKSRSKHAAFFARSDVECSPDCSGVNLPLLGLNRHSDATSKASSVN